MNETDLPAGGNHAAGEMNTFKHTVAATSEGADMTLAETIPIVDS